MAKLGRKPVYKTPDEKADAIKDTGNAWWDRNKDEENYKRRKRYAQQKEEVGRTVRRYTPRQEALRAKQRQKESAKGVEEAVDSPQARVHRTVQLTQSRARSTIDTMHSMFDGSREDFFLKVCEDYITCDDLSCGEENIDRISTRLSSMLAVINQFEDSILNSVGSQAQQMKEYQGMRCDVRDAMNMALEIQEAVMVGGKVEVLYRASNGVFAFQTTLKSD
ncbi:hypothetical protein BKA70DRAFT_1221077 [Coprinopsis sp. MPI-PUGE-AT-0042]|nr:hypothetical protein BKA70DRAFT_1221077 [Coprinopsis sp. MPI-PUGE-AT-0042]